MGEFMIKELFLDLKDYDESMRIYRRKGVRGLIEKDGKFLMVHGKYGDYKFPGGGMKENESLIDTLCREVLEETGFAVLPESAEDFILVHEKRRGIFNDLLDMDSWYYFCEIGDEVFERKLDAYEIEYDYQVVWLSPEEALKKNSLIEDRKYIPWVDREIMVLRYLLNLNDSY